MTKQESLIYDRILRMTERDATWVADDYLCTYFDPEAPESAKEYAGVWLSIYRKFVLNSREALEAKVKAMNPTLEI